MRRTLRAPIGCVGIGLHSGARVTMTLRPAAPGAGIVFRRTDINLEIPARFDQVGDTRLCTALGASDRPDRRIGTVEHVLAALAGAGVHDALVELDGPEVPILDGSARDILFLIDSAGVVDNGLPLSVLEVLKPIRVTETDDTDSAWAELRPAANGAGWPAAFEAALTIDFPNTAIGRQSLAVRVTPQTFRHALADARTFTLAEDVARLRAAGLARGGSLANAVVVDGPMVLNPTGLRTADEFVRHKLLDVVGDLSLAGHPISGRFSGYRSGHALNNRLLRAMFADRAAWRVVEQDWAMPAVSRMPPLRVPEAARARDAAMATAA
ncbi:UDP-3-O-[3-hydroxymyristoyl] N-acetylglucosamine deacetylase [Humitalea rosea]|uniref:UDP-3-O-acyl-N-acetylglucosamine deacetylase n=1 Tax=Humitalea rosea TaxID=990373 RepID=A0A2W7IJ23_9PROT|nr:UDP-3-O-acyl-N-acetylglucosamine deacetylase [Humitalea rosea]PZW37979.1 UDP-3-O-[3-hydroxymyristoyl] N-acetylglucosamine deacetylase [Humitalea rosea]